MYSCEHVGVALLIDEAQAYSEPTEAERVAFRDQELKGIQLQKERTLTEQKERRDRIEAKLRESGGDGALERRRARQAAKGGGEASASGLASHEERSEDTMARMPYVHYTLGESGGIPGYVPCTREMLDGLPTGTCANTYTTLKEATYAGICTYPTTVEERARCDVFEDMHETGRFLSTGRRDGGDFVL